jgi:hypothetical protein
VARAQAVTVEQLAFADAYLTWTKEANGFEDRLDAMWERLRANPHDRVQAQVIKDLRLFEEELRTTKLEYDEWTILFREKLMVERALWQIAAGATDSAKEPAETDIERTGAYQLTRGRKPGMLMPIGAAVYAGLMVFVAGTSFSKAFRPAPKRRRPEPAAGKPAQRP